MVAGLSVREALLTALCLCGFVFLLTNFKFSPERCKIGKRSDKKIARAIQTNLLAYRLEFGDYPMSLYYNDDGKCKDSAGVRGNHFDGEPGLFLDVWGRPFHYIKTADGYVLFCLGKDGLIGGSGLDEDIVVGPHDWSDSRKISND